MDIDIRRIREDELPAFIDTISTAFLDRPDVERVATELRSMWDMDRTWGAFDEGRVCGTFRSWATEITVPGGGCLPAAAVSAVTVLPTHRRRGILRRLIAADHAAARERGDALGILHASEYPIYSRFGYGMAAREAVWTLDTRDTAFHGTPTGTVELARLDEASRDLVKGVFETWRGRQPGEIRRRSVSWDFALGIREEFWGTPWKGFVALHRDEDGTVDGYARYHVDGKWENRQPRGVLFVDELHALTDDAGAALWRFVSSVDWIASVRAERRSPSDRLPWLVVNARAATASEVGDGLWLRLFDVVRALEERRYEREDRLVLEIVDPEAPGGRTTLALDAGPDGATCRRSDRSPDLTVHVAALGAAYLGGTRIRDAVLEAGADEHSSGALGRTDALLRTADEPWCSTFF
jgi:predicted acetyltransferase